MISSNLLKLLYENIENLVKLIFFLHQFYSTSFSNLFVDRAGFKTLHILGNPLISENSRTLSPSFSKQNFQVT